MRHASIALGVSIALCAPATAADLREAVQVTCPEREQIEILYAVTFKTVHGRTIQGGPRNLATRILGIQIARIEIWEGRVEGFGYELPDGRFAAPFVRFHLNPAALDAVQQIRSEVSRIADANFLPSDPSLKIARHSLGHSIEVWGRHVPLKVAGRFFDESETEALGLETWPLDLSFAEAVETVPNWLACFPAR